MQSKQHWEEVYSDKSVDEVSWFQARAGLSLQLIRDSGMPATAAIIDVGGGASVLVDDLLADGYRDLTVLDLSGAALAAARERLGARAADVRWLEADVLDAGLPPAAYDVWHDRAVFHFLTSPRQRQAYVRTASDALKAGGILIVATFAEDGPSRCSGLPVMRYDVDELQREFGADFRLLRHERESHRTPAGREQRFIYCVFRKVDT